MYGQISTLAFIGIEARPVEVQVRISPGKQIFAVVGLPDKKQWQDLLNKARPYLRPVAILDLSLHKPSGNTAQAQNSNEPSNLSVSWCCNASRFERKDS